MQESRRVTNPSVSGTTLERSAIDGDSPVHENRADSFVLFLSTMGHVKPCGNLRGPSRKAKYYSVTDSEQVP